MEAKISAPFLSQLPETKGEHRVSLEMNVEFLTHCRKNERGKNNFNSGRPKS
jgi:hypothetical protein